MQTEAEEAELMVARHGLTGQAARTMVEVGGHLEGNGQAMVDYAEPLRRSIGSR